MAKLKIPDEWWTAPAEGDSGELILVTGRRMMDEIIATGLFNDRIEVTWKYEPDAKGMPDFATSKLMEQVHEALAAEFKKDPVAILTGIYTGAGERNWVFYTRSVNIFGRKINEILAPFELLPITLYAEKDPEWNEYREMSLTEISDAGSDD
ncbi:MAG: DUF695 domain-containing protein [Muribaculaceae bacterium]